MEYQKQQEAKAAEAAGTPAPSTSDSGFDDYMTSTPAPAPAPAPSKSDSGFDDYMTSKPAPAPAPAPEPKVETKKESSYDIDELVGSLISTPAKKTSYDDDYEPFAETKTLAIGKSARKEPKKDYDSSKSKYETRSRYDDEDDYEPRRPVKKARRVEYDYDDDYDDEDDYEYSRPSRRRKGSSRILSRRRRSRYDDDMILDLAEIEYQLRRLNEKHDDVKAIIPQLEQTQLLNRHNFSRGDSISRDQALEMIKKEAIEIAKAEFRKEQELSELRKLASMRESTPPPPPPRAPEPAPAPPPPAPEPTPFPSITGMNNSASGSYSYKSAFAPGSSGVPVLKPMGGGAPSGVSSFGPKPPMGGMNNPMGGMNKPMGGMGNNMQRPGGMPPNGFNPNRR